MAESLIATKFVYMQQTRLELNLEVDANQVEGLSVKYYLHNEDMLNGK